MYIYNIYRGPTRVFFRRRKISQIWMRVCTATDKRRDESPGSTFVCGGNILLGARGEEREDIRMRDKSRPIKALLLHVIVLFRRTCMCVCLWVWIDRFPVMTAYDVSNGALRQNGLLWMVNAWLTRPGMGHNTARTPHRAWCAANGQSMEIASPTRRASIAHRFPRSQSRI